MTNYQHFAAQSNRAQPRSPSQWPHLSQWLTLPKVGLIQRAIKALHAVFELPRRSRMPKAPQRRARSQHRNAEFYLTAQQVRQVIDGAPTTRDSLIVKMFAETAMRRHELIQLRWEDVDCPNKLLVIRNGKGAKMRVIPMTAGLAWMLMGRWPSNDSYTHVFTSRQSLRLSARQVNRIVQRAGAAAGVRHPNPKHQYLTCHLFRHTFARLWKADGGSMETLSSLLGHESQRTTLDEYGREGFMDVQRNYTNTTARIFVTTKRQHNT